MSVCTEIRSRLAEQAKPRRSPRRLATREAPGGCPSGLFDPGPLAQSALERGDLDLELGDFELGGFLSGGSGLGEDGARDSGGVAPQRIGQLVERLSRPIVDERGMMRGHGHGAMRSGGHGTYLRGTFGLSAHGVSRDGAAPHQCHSARSPRTVRAILIDQ